MVENRWLLSKVKYLRKKIKARTAEDWTEGRFEEILSMRMNEHISGKRKKIVSNNDTFKNQDNIVKIIQM